MSSRVTIAPEKGYILVEPKSGDFWEIFECFGKEFHLPEHPDINAIWAFPEGPLKLSYDDLYKIKEMLLKNYPENAKLDRKVAIVVKSGLHSALANEYINIVRDLPIKFQIFSDFQKAEDWIIKKAR